MNHTGRAAAKSTRSRRSANVNGEALAVAIARALDGAKCEDIAALDVRGLSSVTDFMVIASGTSNRQVHTAVEKAAEEAKRLGASVFATSEDANATWALLDLIDVVVHVFQPPTREYYALEALWGDGRSVPWRDEHDDRG